MRFFYDYGTKSVRVIPDDWCPICGTDDCECGIVVADAVNKTISTLAKDFGVPGCRVREYIFERLIGKDGNE